MSQKNAGATEALGHWVASTSGQWQPGDLVAAGQLLIDTIACIASGGSLRQTAKVLKPYQGRGPARIVGTPHTASNEAAALIMGTWGHWEELDEMHYGAGLHAAVGTVPALLAICQGRNATSRDLWDALIVGVEVNTQIGVAMGLAHVNKGWHSTESVGIFGATAACARLLRLNPEACVNALALAASMAAGPKGQFGTEAKPFHAGVAAQGAVNAVYLAQAGLQASSTILEKKDGFGELYGGTQPPDWTLIDLPADGASTAISGSGLAIKWHANCGSTHRAVDAVHDLLLEHDFSVDMVTRVETFVGMTNTVNLKYPDPNTPKEAQFSMNWAVARALRSSHQQLTPDDFTEQALADAPTRALARRVSMTLLEDWEAEKMTNRLAHKVVIHLTDGRGLARDMLWPRGTLGLNALTHEELNSKIMSCMALAPAGTVAAAKAILANPNGSADELMAALSYEPKGRA